MIRQPFEVSSQALYKLIGIGFPCPFPSSQFAQDENNYKLNDIPEFNHLHPLFIRNINLVVIKIQRKFMNVFIYLFKIGLHCVRVSRTRW